MSDRFQSFEKYVRAANYLTTAQIFLRDNFLLERPLEFNDIKPRLLGHWGSGPGVNFAYAHLSSPFNCFFQNAGYGVGRYSNQNKSFLFHK